jgi:hypothetical protein
MGEKVEVGAKLVLDDEASEALHKLHEGFDHVKEKVHEVGHELVSMAKQAAAVALGFQLSGMIDSFKELGHEMLEGAMRAEGETKALAGMITLADKGETSFEELGAKSKELNEHFERLGITMGVTKESLLDAFETIAERSTKGTDHVKEMVDHMAQASRVLPGGMGTLANAFRDLESGIVRPKNALVQLMRQTGVAGGSAKSIAKSLSGMLQTGGEAGQAKVMKLAEEAVERMSVKMAKVPQTFGEVVTSLRGTREAFVEALGAPMLRALVPQFERLKVFLETNRAKIEQFAETMGEKVGQWAEKAAQMIQEGFEYVQTHADEIFKALEGGANALKAAVAFMVEHKNLLIGLYAGQAVVGGLGGAAGVLGASAKGGGALANAGSVLGAGVGAVGKAGMAGAMGVPMTMGMGLAAVAGAGMAAVGAWSLAADQASKLEDETGMGMLQVMGHLVSMDLGESTERLANMDATLRKFKETSHDVSSTSGEELTHFARQIEMLGNEAVAAGDMTAQAFETIRAQTERQLGEELARRGTLDQMAAQAGMGLDAFTQTFAVASAANNAEAENQARKLLEANDTLRQSLVGTMGTVDDALATLKDRLKFKTDGADSIKLPPINFGPTTMRIQQDFRAVDPDRIALVFQRDIAKRAASRIQARTGSPFGF